MKLSPIGEIAQSEWVKTLEIRLDMNLKLGEFVVMPDHLHGIIIIGENPYNTGRDAMHCVSTAFHNGQNQFAPQSKNLASIIRGFKMGVTKHARLINPKFEWQPRYYDNIIRNEQSFNAISQYIRDNPLRWG
jgi:putative transposase